MVSSDDALKISSLTLVSTLCLGPNLHGLCACVYVCVWFVGFYEELQRKKMPPSDSLYASLWSVFFNNWCGRVLPKLGSANWSWVV